jgi:hypothetical protein
MLWDFGLYAADDCSVDKSNPILNNIEFDLISMLYIFSIALAS